MPKKVVARNLKTTFNTTHQNRIKLRMKMRRLLDDAEELIRRREMTETGWIQVVVQVNRIRSTLGLMPIGYERAGLNRDRKTLYSAL